MTHLLTIEINEDIPVLNSLYRTNKYQKVYKSAKAKAFTDYIIKTFQQNQLYEEELKLIVDFYICRDCDIDAKLKILLDSLQNVIYKNDSQIYELVLRKHKVKGKQNIKTIIEFHKLK